MRTLLLAIVSGTGIAAVIFIMFSFASLYPLEHAPSHDWKIYRKIDTPGLNDTYQVNQTIQFTVLNKGYGDRPCMTPDVVIYNNDNPDNPVFRVKGGVIECPPQTQFENYTLYYPSKTNPYVTSVNKAGNYTLGISFGVTSILKQFSIMPSQESNKNQNVTLTADKNQFGSVFTFHDPYQNIDNSTGIVTIRNQAYYSLVLNDTATSYKSQGTKISFHDVIFTLLPTPPFMGPIGWCGGVGLEAVAKFPDDTYEPVAVSVLYRPCSMNYTETDLTVHTNPQAGLTVSDQEIRLLVSRDNQFLESQSQKEYVESIPLDFSNASNENPLGIEAKIVNEPDTAIMCPTENCKIPPTPHLVLTSQKGSQFAGYEVCDGSSCKKDRLSDGLYVWLANIPENFSGATGIMIGHINLGDLPWKKGDIVHIKVIAFPATMLENNIVVRHTDQIMIVDLGKSRIE